jgi:AcrR family transcriptional regulator
MAEAQKSQVIDGRTLRAKARREATKEVILSAGERIFSSQGYLSSSVADVIASADVARGTFYLHFDSKEALFQELVDRFIDRVRSVVRVVEPGPGPRPLLQIKENVERVVHLLFDQRDLAILVLREATGLDARVDEKLRALDSFLHEMVMGALKNGSDMGIIRKVNEGVVALALIGAIKEVLFHMVIREDATHVDREEVSETLFQFGLRGLLQ